MKTNNCKNCLHRYAVYRKSSCGFWKNDFSYCDVKQTLITSAHYCERWQKKTKEYDVSDKRLEQAEKDIKYLIENLR